MNEDFEMYEKHKIENRQEKEPKRIKYARYQLSKNNISWIENHDNFVISLKEGFIKLYPFTGWFCGLKPLGKIKGRGIHVLINEIVRINHGL